MKAFVVLLSLVMSGIGALAQSPTASVSPVERGILAAEQAVQKEPARYQAYNDLAYNLARRVRETSDRAYYHRADQALAKSFQIAPKNFEGQKVQVMVLLGEHEYTRALDEARGLNRKASDDILLWGYLADAESAIGDYDEAEKAAQWMIDLRPDNVPGLLRGASLRKVWGDPDGALEFLNEAYKETPPFEVGDVAAILTEMADIDLAVGKPDSAAKLLGEALDTFPDYWLALEGLARVRISQKRYVDAVELLQKRNQSSLRPQSNYALAQALELTGRANEARQAYDLFEKNARQEIDQADNLNRELILYYVDHTPNPAEALRIARIEIARRHDVYTLDAYAWALHATGDNAAARTQIEKALADGVHDAGVFYHAGAIAAKLGDGPSASEYMKQSLDLNPASEVSDAARLAFGAMVSMPQTHNAGNSAGFRAGQL